MTVLSAYRLIVELRPGYAERLAALSERFASFRIEQQLDWPARIEAWLRNFRGLVDQMTALGLLERVRLVSRPEEVEGCKALLAELGRSVAPGKLRHFADETSGGLLIRILEKEVEVDGGTLLRPSSFNDADLTTLLKSGVVPVIWDRFNGSGVQLMKKIATYKPSFDALANGQSELRFAYLAGHEPKEVPTGVHVHRWITTIPMVTDQERSLCSRYAKAAGSKKRKMRYDTGALLTFSDNIPNNAPLVLWAHETSMWAPLFERIGTRPPKPLKR